MSKNPPTAPGVGLGSAMATRPRVPAVNLLPAYVANRQAGRALQVKALVALALVVLVLVAGYVGVSIWKGAADSRLAKAESEAQRLAEEKEQYAEVIKINEELKATGDALMVAVSYEIRWPELIYAMFDNVPDGSVVSSITLQGMSAGKTMSSSGNVLAPAAIGSATIMLDVPDMPGVSAWVRGFNSIPGLEFGTYSAATKRETPRGEVWTATCSAQINLVGLVGNELFPKDFQEWLLTAQAQGAGTTTEEGKTD
ncbi:MAG: hypothetical protein LBC97_15275 [Bifidobacteriaceae bacterium]|jgi:hypothetical protein|nr:hypothetical protein [Bifidobacteriaceae bacterium]